jgi:hypothetical protein
MLSIISLKRLFFLWESIESDRKKKFDIELKEETSRTLQSFVSTSESCDCHCDWGLKIDTLDTSKIEIIFFIWWIKTRSSIVAKIAKLVVQ